MSIPYWTGQDEPELDVTDPDADYETTLKRHQYAMQEYETLRARRTARRLLDAEEQAQTPPLVGQLLTRDQLGNLPTTEPLIERVLSRHTLAYLTGRDHTYKTFIALDWSLCLATGRHWQGRPTERTRVLYIAAEGAYGINARVDAWEGAWRTSVDPDWFVTLPRPVDLHAGHVVPELLEIAGGFGLVVVDTLRRVSGRARENDSDMGQVTDNIDQIKHATDAGTVLVLAHTDKGDNDARGHSSIEDDADTVWHAKRTDEGQVTLECRKMKNGPDGEKLHLLATPSHDSLIIEGTVPGLVDRNRVSEAQTKILDALAETFAHTNGATATELQEVTGLSKSTFYHARGALLAARLIESNGPSGRSRYTLTGPTESNPTSEDETAGQHPSSPISPTESNRDGPVQSSPTPLKGLDVGLDPGPATKEPS